MSSPVYQEALTITKDYLGPAAERFINRQIAFHLGKTPEQLQPADIPQLTEWVKVSIAVLTEDKTMVDDFSARILSLVE
ncbi:MAG TPA: hypothetical protein VK963_01835 [Candidatus Saccharimonadales bacterium]|nr:hypothetical protein [Candidatus Saccharimonadales bacterium]